MCDKSFLSKLKVSRDDAHCAIRNLTLNMNTIISSKSAKFAAGLVGLVAGFALVATTVSAATFTTNLKQGSTGADVKNLQMVLNTDPATQVSVSGAGSPGNETSYFGPATKAAVIKFQNKYASDILAPVGLTAGTGYVGASTRAKLNTMETTPVTTTGCTTAFDPMTGLPCSTTGTVVTLPAGCTSTTGYSSTTGTKCDSGTTTTTTTGPVTVALAAIQPNQMVVVGQSGAKLADFVFSGNGTVTNMQLQRVGISPDSVLANVYLYDGNTRITDAASVITGGYINFNSPSGLFTVNGTRTISVRADIASTATAGNSVGVMINTVTTQGGTASAVTGVQGNQLVLASVSTAAVNFAALSTTALTPDAGVTNYTIWSGSATVSTRAANLKAATFKFVGSAPVDALANINLFVDGTKVGNSSTINAANNNKVTFDLGATPYVLTTGTHTIEVRADIVKGSFRTVTMSVENVSDLMFEDSTLSGVNVSATIASAAFTQSGATYGTITINAGSVTVGVDPTFTTTSVTGGATNVPVGQFTMKAYGEDVKVSSLRVTFSTTTITTLNNVGLYVNGGQVGSSQNFLGTAPLTFTLGSSLIIPAGTTVTLTVKADMVDSSSAAYTSGTVATVLGGVGASSNNAQGQSSYEVIDVAASAVTSGTLTVSSGAGTFVRTSGFVTATTSPNSANVKIGSFVLSAGSAEDLKVTSIGVNPAVAGFNGGTAITIANYSNLTVKTGSTVLGTPVGNPSAGTSTFSFSEIVVAKNGSLSFDVYADIGGAASSTANPTVTAAASVTYRGSISNTTTTSSAAGVAIASASATLAAPTLVSSSPVEQYVIGGSTMGIATFKLKTASAGTNATVTELRFTTTGTDAVESITVGGVTKAVTGSGAGATTTITGLNIPVTFTGVDVPVTVKFSGFLGSTTGGSLTSGIAAVSITLGHVEGTSGTSGAITNTTPVSSNSMKLYASKPTVTGPAVTSGSLSSGVQKIGEFTVTADTNGKVAVATTSIKFSTSTSGTINVTSVMLSDDGGATAIANSNTVTAPVSGTAFTIGFTTPYEISAGASKTFSIYATVTGSYGTSGASSMSTQLDSTIANFLWNDVVSGSNGLTGTGIQNFGVSSYTLRN